MNFIHAGIRANSQDSPYKTTILTLTLSQREKEFEDGLHRSVQ